MTDVIHPAKQCDFADLEHCLDLDVKKGLIDTRDYGPLRQYTYSRQCVYARAWSPTTLMARGLILNLRDRKVVAIPFPKFFNLGESTESIPMGQFHTYEKVDGSLIIAFHDGNYWCCATKGSFTSDQAYWASRKLGEYGFAKLDIGTTYLFEAVYAANKIVVDYHFEDVVLLGAYNPDGIEYEYDWLIIIAKRLGCRLMKRYEFDDHAAVVAHAATITKDEEGFVLHWPNGYRLKVKGEEYLKIHRAISGLTPLEVWRRMLACEDMNTYRKHLPEEWWADFDGIYVTLAEKMHEIMKKGWGVCDTFVEATDKEVGLQLRSMDQEVASIIFPLRRGKHPATDERLRRTIYNLFKPKGNSLPGYVPSPRLKFIEEESL